MTDAIEIQIISSKEPRERGRTVTLQTVLNGFIAGFFRSDSDDFVDRRDEDFAIPDLPGSRGLDDGR